MDQTGETILRLRLEIDQHKSRITVLEKALAVAQTQASVWGPIVRAAKTHPGGFAGICANLNSSLRKLSSEEAVCEHEFETQKSHTEHQDFPDRCRKCGENEV